MLYTIAIIIKITIKVIAYSKKVFPVMKKGEEERVLNFQIDDKSFSLSKIDNSLDNEVDALFYYEEINNSEDTKAINRETFLQSKNNNENNSL